MYTGQLIEYGNWDAEGQRIQDKLMVELKTNINVDKSYRLPQFIAPLLRNTTNTTNTTEESNFISEGFEYRDILRLR